MKQYTLTNWTMENHQSIFGAFVLRGLIQGHPTIPDGTEVRTTAVTSMDNEAGVAYTHHSGAFAITTATMSDAWRQQVMDGSGGADTDGSSFLQDSFEQGPFQDDDYSTSASSDDDQDAVLGGEGGDAGDIDLNGDGSNDGLNGDDDSPDLGLADLLASLGAGDDDGLGADADAVPAPKRARKSRAKAAA